MLYALTTPGLLLAAYLLGGIGERVLRRRVGVSRSSVTVVAVLSICTTMLIAGLIDSNAQPWHPLVMLSALALTTVVLGALALILAGLRPPPEPTPVTELIRSGESNRLEFKSSARWNVHTKERDERLERAIAKSVVGFLNADGGELLIGVDDAGVIVGLDQDFALVRSNDADRYELWLRDMLQQGTSPATVASLRVDFTPVVVDGSETFVCRLSIPPSPVPVYLQPVKGSPQTEFWVRSGNSTRQLRVDEATNYVMQRWPLGFGRTLASHIRALSRVPRNRRAA